MKLFPDGTIAQDTDTRDNTIVLGAPHLPTIISWEFPPDGRADAELIVQCQLVVNGAVAALMPAGDWHMGFMMRSVIADIPSGHYKGLGPIFGPVWSPTDPATPPYVDHPGEFVWRLEDWGVGVVPPDFESLRTGSCSPRISDGMRLRVWMSCKRYAGEVYSRYILAALNLYGQYTPMVDTGDVQSNNWGVDRWQETLSLFDIGRVGTSDYSITLINLSARQQWATCRVPDMRTFK